MTIDLSKFVDEKVVITFRDGSKETGIVTCTAYPRFPYLVVHSFYEQNGKCGRYKYDIIHIELAEKKVKESLTDASINAISKVVANHIRHDVYDMVANKIRSEFNDEISEPLVYKIAIAAIKKL